MVEALTKGHKIEAIKVLRRRKVASASRKPRMPWIRMCSHALSLLPIGDAEANELAGRSIDARFVLESTSGRIGSSFSFSIAPRSSTDNSSIGPLYG